MNLISDPDDIVISPGTFFGWKKSRTEQLLPLWTREEECQKTRWEKEAVAIAKVERCYHEQIRKIREETRRELNSPPDLPSETTGKRSDAATFVTDLLQKYDVKEYIRTVQSDESSITKEISDDVDIYSLFSSGSDV